MKVKKECEEADDFLAESHEKEVVKAKKEGNGRRKMKRKRGRPPKMDLKEEDQLDDQFPRKRGGVNEAHRVFQIGDEKPPEEPVLGSYGYWVFEKWVLP